MQAQADFYLGDDFLLAAWKDGDVFFGTDLLGNVSKAPGILCALGCKSGRFRTPGKDIPFSMQLILDEKKHTPPLISVLPLTSINRTLKFYFGSQKFR